VRSSDYSILAMLQRRMTRAAVFPIAGYDQVVREVAGVYRSLGAEERFAHAARLTQHDVTEEFGGRVIEWLDRHMFEVREGSHAGALAR